MNGFDPTTLKPDIETFKKIFQDFAQTIPATAWSKNTGTRDNDWTLHETIAHLVSIAMAFNRATDAAMHKHKLITPGMNQRSDLRAWNESEISSRETRPHMSLVAEFISELDRTLQYLETITPEQMQQKILLNVYNRPAPAIHFLGWQLSHGGVIHAAQVARPLEKDPLWTHYPDDMMWRQVDRFVKHFSVAYWNDYGPEQAEAINFHIGDKVWHLIAAPDGGSADEGAHNDPKYVLKFDTPETFFNVFTTNIRIRDALSSGAMVVESDFGTTMGLIKLFSPMPPGETL